MSLFKICLICLFTLTTAGGQNNPLSATMDAISAGQTRVTAHVHQAGDYTLTVTRTGTPHTFTAQPDSRGLVTFDLTTNEAIKAGLQAGDTVRLGGGQIAAGSEPSLTVAAADPTMKAKLKTPIWDKASKVEATVHLGGDYELTVTRAGSTPPDPLKLTALPTADGLLSFDLKKDATEAFKELKEGDQVVVKGPGATNLSTTVRKAPEVTVLVTPPAEGSQVVKGMVVGDADKVRVTVLSRGSVVDFDVASVTPENGKNVFTSALNRILSAGQTVQVVALKEEAEVGTADYTLVRSVLFDWGRVRAYFSLGSTVAKQTKGEPPSQETEFTNAEWWLGLNLDYNWYSRLKPRLADRCARPQRVRDEIDRAEQLLRKYLPQFRQVQSLYRNGEKPNREWLKNELRKMRIYEVVPIAGDFMQKNFRAIQEGYTEACVNKQFSDEQAALDSLKRIDIAIEESRWGVKKEPEADVVADGASLALRVLAELQRMDNNYIAGGWLFNTSFEGRLSQAPITDLRSEAGLSVILQNPQSAVFELAAYAPVFKSWTSWRFGDQDNTLFIAPIVKAGTIVPTGKHEGVFSDARQNTYHYWNAGFRFGHLQLDPRPKSVAPELLSHLDVTVGKFDNFRTPRRRPPTGEPLEGDQFNRDLRVETHGRFKIPFMPIYLGFTSNFGPGPDDTRVFFGTRFDIGEAIAKVIPRATR